MSALIRTTDWAATPLGPIERWPQSLRTVVALMLASDFQMAIHWGAQLIEIHNDAFIEALQHRHPAALGQPMAQVWPELWDDIRPGRTLPTRQQPADRSGDPRCL